MPLAPFGLLHSVADKAETQLVPEEEAHVADVVRAPGSMGDVPESVLDVAEGRCWQHPSSVEGSSSRSRWRSLIGTSERNAA